LHLEWRYADGDKQTDTPAATLQPVVAIPPQEALQHLYQLTLIGHTTAIQEYVAELARSDEHLAPFAANVEGMAHRIQISELCAYLEQYLEP
jgi:hypothetical protein